MKWIGQHIYDLVSRFRDDVYLEDLSTTTETNVLVVDSAGKVSKSTTLADDIIEAEIDTLAGLTSFGAAGVTTNVLAGDLTIYNTVNDGSPTLSIGSSAENRFEMVSKYNSGAQTLDAVYLQTFTTSSTTNDGRFLFYVDSVSIFNIIDSGVSVNGVVSSTGDGVFLRATDTTASSATQGGKLQLQSDDGAAMGDDHRLGVIEFKGAEDGSNTRSIGARIQAICRDAWDGSNNDADLEFYTTDGTTESKVLTLDADKLATFTGAVTATGALTGTLATVSQPNITGVGTIDTGVWRGTAITSTYLDADTAHLSGTQTFTGTKTLNSFKGTGGATVTNILDEDAMGSDSATALATQQSIKAYADRPAKQIVLMRAAFKDDIGTAKHYIPLQSELEQTNSFHEMNSFVAPFDGKLLKLMYNGSGNFSGGEFSFTLEQIPRNVAFATTPTVLETIAIDGPTNDTTDPNMIIANFVGGSGTNSFTAGDLIMVGIQSDADVTSSTSKHFFTLVFEFDFSSLA